MVIITFTLQVRSGMGLGALVCGLCSKHLSSYKSCSVHSLSLSLSITHSLCSHHTHNRGKKKKEKTERNNVFPKQTPRHGLNEAVCNLLYFLVFWFQKRVYCVKLLSFFIWGVGLIWIRMMSDYKVEMINDGMQEFFVEFHGPKDSNFLHPFCHFFRFHFFSSLIWWLIWLCALKCNYFFFVLILISSFT